MKVREEEMKDESSRRGRKVFTTYSKRANHRVHGLARCTPGRGLASSLTRNYSTNMDPIELALKDLKLQNTKNISAVAKLHGVDRSTLSRRFNGVTNPAKMQHEKQQLLSPQQEKELIEYIIMLTKRGTLPTTAMVRNFAGDIAGKLPGRCWSQRFCMRHQDALLSRYLKNIDIQRQRQRTQRAFRRSMMCSSRRPKNTIF